MDRSEVIRLARHEAAPAVTIMMPIDQPVRMHPDLALRLRSLTDKGLAAVDAWYGQEAAKEVRNQLDRAVSDLDESPKGQGLAVLCTPDERWIFDLPFDVSEQVVVDTSFATRQLLVGLARHPTIRVLVLAGHRARLLEGTTDRLTEVLDHGFPLDVDPPHEWDTPQKDLPIHEASAEEELRFVIRAVDDALDPFISGRPLPLITVAVDRELARFVEVSRHGDHMVGRVAGSHIRTPPAAIADLCGVPVEQYLEAKGEEAAGRLRDAHDHERAVVGLAATMQAAGECRGHELVVEADFTAPRHFVDGLTPGPAPDQQLDVDDRVDDLIERVLLAGGEVSFVGSGDLAEAGRIGLILRY